jgi:hypothetical protein
MATLVVERPARGTLNGTTHFSAFHLTRLFEDRYDDSSDGTPMAQPLLIRSPPKQTTAYLAKCKNPRKFDP